MRYEIEKAMAKFGIIPVVVLNDSKNSLSLARALVDGGLPCAEVTFRTDAAEESIKQISSNFPDMLVGAGTVISIEQVNRAVNAGAKFIVSPGFDAEIVDYCIKSNILIFPGCVTPSEVMQAVKRGIKILKFFPAEQYGGISTIKAFSGPFPGVKFIPTGGIKISNLKEYLESDKVFACGGTWMVKDDMIRNGEFDKIKSITKEAVDIVREIKGGIK